MTGLGRLVVVISGRDLITMWESPLVVNVILCVGPMYDGPNVLWIRVDLVDVLSSWFEMVVVCYKLVLIHCLVTRREVHTKYIVLRRSLFFCFPLPAVVLMTPLLVLLANHTPLQQHQPGSNLPGQDWSFLSSNAY